MGLDEFFDYLSHFPIDEYVVHLKYRIDERFEWEESNEILEVDTNMDYVWLNDWWEGEKDVLVCGFRAVSDLVVDGFPVRDSNGIMTVDNNGIDSIVAKETHVGIAVANIDLFAINSAIDNVCERDGGSVSVFVSKDMFDRLSPYVDHREDGDYFGFNDVRISVNDFLESDSFCVMGAWRDEEN